MPLVSLVSIAVAATLLSLDPSRERVIIGEMAKAKPVEGPLKDRDHVQWKDAAKMQNGIVRARFNIPPKSEASILLRLAFAPSGDLDEGYAFTATRTGPRVERILHGGGRSLGADDKKPLPEQIEMVVMALGPWFSVDIYDAQSLQSLWHASLHDESFTGGLVAARAMAKATTSLLTYAPLSDMARAPVLHRSGDTRVVDQGSGPHLVDPVQREKLFRQGSLTRDDARVSFRMLDQDYKDAEQVADWLKTQPGELESIGKTHEGRDIWAMRFGPKGAPSVLLDGAHHGGELMSTELVLDAVMHFAKTPPRDLSVWCVPIVNVDGNMHFMHDSIAHVRKNARDVTQDGVLDEWEGVDLYRNYPMRHGALGEEGSRSWPPHWRYRGQTPASEPEVQAMMRLAERERFVASIDFHTASTAILVPYTDPGMRSPEPNDAWAIATQMAEAAPMQPSRRRYRVLRNLYPVDGTAQDFFRFTYGTVALLVEAPLHNPLPYVRHRDKNVAASRPVWKKMLELVRTQPSISGHVHDAQGKPVVADVHIAEQTLTQGEHWQSAPADGRYFRFVPTAGRYTLQVRAAGYAAVDAPMQIDHPVSFDVTLRR